MEKSTIEELEQRVGQLEHLAWSLFRTLETYITFSDRPSEKKRRHDDCFEQKANISENEMEKHIE